MKPSPFGKSYSSHSGCHLASPKNDRLCSPVYPFRNQLGSAQCHWIVQISPDYAWARQARYSDETLPANQNFLLIFVFHDGLKLRLIHVTSSSTLNTGLSVTALLPLRPHSPPRNVTSKAWTHNGNADFVISLFRPKYILDSDAKKFKILDYSEKAKLDCVFKKL